MDLQLIVFSFWLVLQLFCFTPNSIDSWLEVLSKWATTRQNMSSGVSDQVRLKLACSAAEASWNLEISAIESRYYTI